MKTAAKYDLCTYNYHFLDRTSKNLFLGVYQPIKILPQYPCDVLSIPKDYRQVGNGLIFQKKWPYKSLINFHIRKVVRHF